MKFCPNCGRKREEEIVCDCGYNYETGEAEMKEPVVEEIVPHLGAVELDELKRRKLDVGDLLAATYGSSGGMMGGFCEYELSFEDNKLITHVQDWHHGSKFNRTYKVDLDKVKEIKDILIENNFRAWSEVPVDMGIMMFDAPNSYLKLRFEELTATIPTKIYMTDEERNIMANVRDMIYKCANPDNLIEEVILEEGQPINPAFMGGGMMGGPVTHAGFCPDCGKLLKDGGVRCDCGYEYPQE